MRVVLAIYLTLATAAGPWLCCCSANRLAALAAAARAPVPSPKPACCHCHGTPAPKPTPSTPARPPLPSCPCGEGRPTAAVLVHSGTALLPQTDLKPAYVMAPALGASGPGLIGGGELLQAGNAVWPFATARDLLHARHILRC
jgi:hypothetical protein